MERKKLKNARQRHHLTLAQAAERLQVDINTLWRWEGGKTSPRAYNVIELCKLYNLSAIELDLEEFCDSNIHASSNLVLSDDSRKQTFGTLLREDLTLALQEIVFAWPSYDKCYRKLQAQIQQTIEDFCAMKHSDDLFMTRREALRRLAFLPVQLCGLSAFRGVLSRTYEEILTQCAAGIAACEELSSEGDLSTSFSLLATYLPTLTTIVWENAVHRQSAAALATQCLLAQTILATHLEGYPQALSYAKQAVTYSEATNDVILRITALGRLAWVYSSNNQRKIALESAFQMQELFQQNKAKYSSNIQSYVSGVVAKNLALNKKREEAQKYLQQAHEAFFTPFSEEASIKHDLANFLVDDGVTHLFLAQPEAALNTFTRIIHPEKLTSHIPLSRRFRPEVLNNLTLALLKIPQKDMEQIIFCWQAGLQEAQALRSEQRFEESVQLQELMEIVWPGEKRITELRDLTVHW